VPHEETNFSAYQNDIRVKSANDLVYLASPFVNEVCVFTILHNSQRVPCVNDLLGGCTHDKACASDANDDVLVFLSVDSVIEQSRMKTVC